MINPVPPEIAIDNDMILTIFSAPIFPWSQWALQVFYTCTKDHDAWLDAPCVSVLANAFTCKYTKQSFSEIQGQGHKRLTSIFTVILKKYCIRSKYGKDLTKFRKLWRSHTIWLKYICMYSVLHHFSSMHSGVLSTSSMFIDILQWVTINQTL